MYFFGLMGSVFGCLRFSLIAIACFFFLGFMVCVCRVMDNWFDYVSVGWVLSFVCNGCWAIGLIRLGLLRFCNFGVLCVG